MFLKQNNSRKTIAKEVNNWTEDCVLESKSRLKKQFCDKRHKVLYKIKNLIQNENKSNI